jgi:APA family basic amino acid/polyamine antiporter
LKVVVEMENGVRKRGCTLSKQDFLPEESFQSWGNYVKALGSTKTRLKDCLLTLSLNHMELQDMHARSQYKMKNNARIFVPTGEATRNDAGPAMVISYLISGVLTLLSVMCYTEFAVELPVAEVPFAYLRVGLGDFMAYIAAGNSLFEYIVCGASVARSWTSYFATLCNHKPNDFRINVSSSLAEGYNHLDPIAIVVSIAISFGACLSMKGSSRFFNSTATIIHIYDHLDIHLSHKPF